MIDTFEIPAVQRIVSRQLSRWHSEQKAADERRRGPTSPPRHPPTWITISREPGAGGRELAMMLAEQLDFELFDRNLLDRMAAAGRLDASGLARVEAGPHDRVHEAVYLSLDRAYPGHHAYLKQLISIGTALAARGRAILLGRGLHLILPGDHGVRVRLVAPMESRVDRVRRRLDCDEARARDWIDRTDRNQIELVRNLLRRDLRDVYAYDLVLNTGSMSIEDCAAAVVGTLERRSSTEEAAHA